MNKNIPETISDFSTAGVVSSILLASINNLPHGIQTLISFGIPSLACIYNICDRSINERIAKKDAEKIDALLKELQLQMKMKNISDLQRFIDLDFSPETYANIEQLVKNGINSKSKWIRKLIALTLVNIGSAEIPNEQGLDRYIKILQELDDVDIRLLILYNYRINNQFKSQKCISVFDDICSDDSASAISIKVSGIKLSNLGLVIRISTLQPYDDNDNCNKKKMIEDFLSVNYNEPTKILSDFFKFLAFNNKSLI